MATNDEPGREPMSDERLAASAGTHDTCPKCGALTSAFERLGSGICNECLSKRIKRHQRKRAFAR